MAEIWTYVICVAVWGSFFSAMAVAFAPPRRYVHVMLFMLSLGWLPLVLWPARQLPGTPSTIYSLEEETVIIAGKYETGEAIYLYLDQPGAPRSVVLPWNEDLAKQLEKAKRKQRESGEEIILKGTLTGTHNYKAVIQNREHKPAPPKEVR